LKHPVSNSPGNSHRAPNRRAVPILANFDKPQRRLEWCVVVLGLLDPAGSGGFGDFEAQARAIARFARRARSA